MDIEYSLNIVSEPCDTTVKLIRGEKYFEERIKKNRKRKGVISQLMFAVVSKFQTLWLVWSTIEANDGSFSCQKLCNVLREQHSAR